jgi:hypothetical protein
MCQGQTLNNKRFISETTEDGEEVLPRRRLEEEKRRRQEPMAPPARIDELNVGPFPVF